MGYRNRSVQFTDISSEFLKVSWTWKKFVW